MEVLIINSAKNSFEMKVNKCTLRLAPNFAEEADLHM